MRTSQSRPVFPLPLGGHKVDKAKDRLSGDLLGYWHLLTKALGTHIGSKTAPQSARNRL